MRREGEREGNLRKKFMRGMWKIILFGQNSPVKIILWGKKNPLDLVLGLECLKTRQQMPKSVQY